MELESKSRDQPPGCAGDFPSDRKSLPLSGTLVPRVGYGGRALLFTGQARASAAAPCSLLSGTSLAVSSLSLFPAQLSLHTALLLPGPDQKMKAFCPPALAGFEGPFQL